MLSDVEKSMLIGTLLNKIENDFEKKEFANAEINEDFTSYGDYLLARLNGNTDYGRKDNRCLFSIEV